MSHFCPTSDTLQRVLMTVFCIPAVVVSCGAIGRPEERKDKGEGQRMGRQREDEKVHKREKREEGREPTRLLASKSGEVNVQM